MGNSLRGISSAMSASGFGFHKNNSLDSIFPIVLQNFLSTATANVNASTTFVDVVSPGVAGTVMGSGLQVELQEGGGQSFNNWWNIEVYGAVNTAATQGVQMKLVALDGLTITSTTNFTYNYNAAAAVVNVNQPVGTAATAGAVNVTGFLIKGAVQIAGYGRLGLQFTQAVNTAANTNIASGVITATAIIA